MNFYPFIVIMRVDKERGILLYVYIWENAIIIELIITLLNQISWKFFNDDNKLNQNVTQNIFYSILDLTLILIFYMKILFSFMFSKSFLK